MELKTSWERFLLGQVLSVDKLAATRKIRSDDWFNGVYLGSPNQSLWPSKIMGVLEWMYMTGMQKGAFCGTVGQAMSG